ncbi:MAG TPA: hypothetical protein VHX88_16650 [Solirubrobacteraceae bacterium]|jgi:hypothetical protein|nr:hypothetical protein [Solirubrobacteraceae bacterium]
MSAPLRRPPHARRWLAALVLVGALASPGIAWANAGQQIISECMSVGRVTGHFSQKAYDQALAELNGDIAEYSNCPAVIRQAALSALAASRSMGGGNGGGGVGPTSGAGSSSPVSATVAPPSAQEKAAISVAHSSGGDPVDLGNGVVVTPDRARATVAGAFSTLPTPLLATVFVLLAAALVTLARPLIRHVRPRRFR